MSTTTPFDWMTPGAAGGAHPVAAVVARLHDELDLLFETPVWSMDAAQTRDTLAEVTRLTARVAGLELRVVAHADQIGAGEDVGCDHHRCVVGGRDPADPGGGAPQGQARGRRWTGSTSRSVTPWPRAGCCPTRPRSSSTPSTPCPRRRSTPRSATPPAAT